MRKSERDEVTLSHDEALLLIEALTHVHARSVEAEAAALDAWGVATGASQKAKTEARQLKRVLQHVQETLVAAQKHAELCHRERLDANACYERLKAQRVVAEAQLAALLKITRALPLFDQTAARVEVRA